MMEILTLIGGLATLIGIIAGVIQVVDYFQKLREQRNNLETGVAPRVLLKRSQLERDYLAWVIEVYKEWDFQFTPRVAQIIEEMPVSVRPEMRLLVSDRSPAFITKFSYVGNLHEMVRHHRHLALLGEPGGGKTTILQKIAYEQAKAALDDDGQPLPVIVRLGDFTYSEEFLSFLVRHLRQQVGEWADQIEDYLDVGRLWLLLDGLDEIPESNIENQVAALRAFIERYSKNVIVVSCRKSEYVDRFNYSKALIQPLDGTQIRDFVCNYLPDSGEKLLQEIEGGPFADLASNPYILRMLTLVYQERKVIPEKYDELVSKFVEVLLERERKRAQELTVHLSSIPVALAHLALSMAMLGYRGATVERAWACSQIPDYLTPDGLVVPISQENILRVAVNATLLGPGLDDRTIRFYHRILLDHFLSKHSLSDLLVQRLETNHSLSLTERQFVEQACNEAVAAHATEQRKSGNPYVYHLVATSLFVADFMEGIDVQVIAAALLHDVYEISEQAVIRVSILFGEEVFTLVEGCQRLNEYIYSLTKELNIEALDDLLTFVDQRVVLIKLADRLHNILTLQFLPLAKQQSVADQTRRIHIPLARMVGQAKMAEKLEQALHSLLL